MDLISDNLNQSGQTYVAWNWKAGTGNTAFSESGNNPAGTHRANVDAGFSIVSYVGTGAAGTVAHGLSAAPEWIIIKNRDVTDDWAVYYGDNTDYLVLSSGAASVDNATYFNDTSPTASVFTVNTAHSVNADAENYIAYCFHSVPGYSKVGSYRGNSSANGAFVHTGFRPAFVIIKNFTYASGTDWYIWDKERDPHNFVFHDLTSNTNAAEDTDDGVRCDFTSNGFKLRHSSTALNNSSHDYTFLCLAETPFKYSNAR